MGWIGGGARNLPRDNYPGFHDTNFRGAKWRRILAVAWLAAQVPQGLRLRRGRLGAVHGWLMTRKKAGSLHFLLPPHFARRVLDV